MRAPSDPTAQMTFTAAQILAEHPDGLRARDLWPLIVERLPTIDQDWAGAGKGKTTAYGQLQFYSIDLVKAGWLTKVGGLWFLTPVGHVALREYGDAQAFYQQHRLLYRDWQRNRAKFDLARSLVEAIPAGSWAAGSEIAAEASLDASRLLQWLQGEQPEGWYRVLDPDGRLPRDGHPDQGGEREDWIGLLEQDGVAVVLDQADPGARILGSDLRQLVSGELADDEEAVRRAWLIRGSNVQGENLVRSLWLRDGLCSLPASRLRDVPPGADTQRVRDAVDNDYSHASVQERARLTAEYHAFLSRVRVGDIVVTNDGTQVYIGEITGGPAFVTSVGNRANLQRQVAWYNPRSPLDYVRDLPDEISARLSNPDADLIELTEFLGDLEKILGEEPQQAVTDVEFHLPDATEGLARGLLVPREWLQECVDLLRERAQLIFYGPPGTGKTYLAQKLASFLADGKPENVQLVQFHPAYSYEDFFEGFRPVKGADGAVGFELTWGPLRRIVAAARARPGDPHVLIIDEINRGNLAKIFGELYFLLEYRSESVNLLYGSDNGQGFTLPRNVVILGTMNSSDRSIALVDTAMRRRFWFQEMHPDEPPVRHLLAEWLKREDQPEDSALLLAALNERIDDRDFRIGPSYLMSETAKSQSGLDRIWRTQLLPLLEEHYYGDMSKAEVIERYGLGTLRADLGLPGTTE
jgi:5-methylcytosine-specific restriction enzyme B